MSDSICRPGTIGSVTGGGLTTAVAVGIG